MKGKSYCRLDNCDLEPLWWFELTNFCKVEPFVGDDDGCVDGAGE